MDPSTAPDVGEDVDMTLRHVSQQFPATFARAILPPGMNVSAATWLDTQVTARQRRLDRVLDVVADGQRRLDLKSAILPHLEKETFMQSWVYKQGKAEGELKGKLETEANAVLRVLRARGLSVPDEVRERILACKDASQLETWLDRASVAGRVEDVLNGH